MTAAKPIRLMLAGNNAIVLACLEQLFALEEDFAVIARCGKGEDALDTLRAVRPDILLLDLPPSAVEGVNLLPFLEGAKTGAPHDALYWRFGQQMAIRAGDWKLVRYDVNADTRTGGSNQGVTAAKLYNLATDIGETNDLAAVTPDRAKELQSRWDEWNKSNVKPLWGAGAAASEPPKGETRRLGSR